MNLIPTEIPVPKNESDFERMCVQVYGVVFQDPSPKINGRKGQAQGGVDVFVNAKGIGRIGVQCKKYFKTTLTLEHVVQEVEKADKNKTPITRLLIATTSPSNANLLHEVQLLSDQRELNKQFAVEVEFWEDIENRINSFTVLQDNYVPHSAGAAYHRQEQKLEHIHELALETRDTIATCVALPLARMESVNKLISAQLDRTNEFLREGRYQDALKHIAAIGQDLSSYDEHQKARWHLQRGLCLWFGREDIKEAADLFLKAANLYPDDERMAAARIRGHLLQEDIGAALEAGRAAIERFPTSQQVWLTYVNAKILNGDEVHLDFVPTEMRDAPDVLQVFALAARKRNDFAEAVALAERAAAHQDAGFFTKGTALGMVVEDAARNTVAAMYGMLSKNQLGSLNRIAALFDPRPEKLWSIQSAAVDEVAAHLGFAYLLLQLPKNALEVVKEAAAHGHSSKELLRVHIMALCELKMDDDVLELGRSCISDLTPESILLVAELAAKHGDIKFFGDALAQVNGWESECQETIDNLTALKWSALSRVGKRDQALKEIGDLQIPSSDSFILVCAAARLMIVAEHPLEASELINRAKTLVNTKNLESERLMLADVFYASKRWLEAAELYKLFTPPGQLSKLHTRLLSCYVEADSRKKAKELLRQLPENWLADDEIRRLAIDLGQNAGDWEFLLPLADAQVKKAPSEAISWLFKLHVARHVDSPTAFQDMIRQVPEELSGSIRNLSQLAGIELRYDEISKGLRRLYRLVRMNFDEPEAFSSYFFGILAVPAMQPLMEESLPVAVAGSALTLVSQDGHELQVVIDPSDVGILPKRTDFIQSNSSAATALVGAKPGEVVTVPAQIGGVQNYTVKSIQPAYRYLLEIARKRAESFGGLPNMKLIPVGASGDAVKDLSYVLEELKRGSEISHQIFEAYGNGQLTLCGVAEMLAKSPFEIALGWPIDVPPIFIGTGQVQEKVSALATLARADASYVTDMLTLTEIVNFGSADVLRALPKLYISPVTLEMLEENLRNAEEDKAVGTAIDVDGKIGFIEYDEKHKERRINLAAEVLGAAKKYCTIQPVYGELIPPAELPNFSDILKVEEREMVLLAKECNSALLTLDGRLRMLAKFGVNAEGVWPQVLFTHCLSKGLISPEVNAEFTIKQFLANRKFVSISHWDLIWLVMQGDSYIQRGVKVLKQYLESADTDLASTSRVMFEFLTEIAHMKTQLGAFGELFVHIFEPIFRRKDCPPGFYNDVEDFIFNLTADLSGTSHLFPLVNLFQEYRVQAQRDYLVSKLVEARRRSSDTVEMRPIAVRVLYCSSIPTLIMDRSIQENAPCEAVRVGERTNLPSHGAPSSQTPTNATSTGK